MSTMQATAGTPATDGISAEARDTEALRDLDQPDALEAANEPLSIEPLSRADQQAMAVRVSRHAEPAQNLYDRIEAFVSRLSVRDNFWHSICSLIWLPLAFFSGIRMKAVDSANKAMDSASRAMDSATKSATKAVESAKFHAAAVLPFRRFNRNWYRAMAGGALLANSEIAGGMYVFGLVGGDYTVVCKHLEYRFLRPCFGPAVYRMTPRENLHERTAAGGEFNVTLDLDVLQQASRVGERDKRVGQCVATFHVTPKVQHKIRRSRKNR